MNIVVIGPKGSGKSTVGKAIAEALELPVVETDHSIESVYNELENAALTYRQIFQKIGDEKFRKLELEAVQRCAALDWHIILTGGGTFMNAESRRALRGDNLILYLTADLDTLWARAIEDGIPSMYEGDDGQEKFSSTTLLRDEIMRPFADVILDTSEENPEDLAEIACELISQELSVRSRSASTFGDVIRLTTFGESHGPAIGGVLEGIRPGIPIDEDAIRVQMERRRPGQSKVVTQRKEKDEVRIMSGIFEGKTTGHPIGFIIENQDQHSKSYDNIKDLFRPGHADFTFYKKYGLRDYRGGGRSSAREQAVRVGAGAIARNILKRHGIEFYAYAVEVGGIEAKTCDYSVIETNPVRCADPIAAKEMEEAILKVRKEQDSIGGIIQLDILNVPVGLGDPVFGKLDARLTYAMMTIGALKGVEVGDGFALTRLQGSESNDNMKDGKFLTNHGGGIGGGISTGQTITLRVALKPTPSISKKQETLDTEGKNVPVEVHGRHDPCLVPRAVPVLENVAALVILDAWEIQRRLNPAWEPETFETE